MSSLNSPHYLDNLFNMLQATSNIQNIAIMSSSYSTVLWFSLFRSQNFCNVNLGIKSSSVDIHADLRTLSLFSIMIKQVFNLISLEDTYSVMCSLKRDSWIYIKRAVKEKWKMYRRKPENLRRWTIFIRHLSDVPVSRSWYKTVSKLDENSYIHNFV